MTTPEQPSSAGPLGPDREPLSYRQESDASGSAWQYNSQGTQNIAPGGAIYVNQPPLRPASRRRPSRVWMLGGAVCVLVAVGGIAWAERAHLSRASHTGLPGASGPTTAPLTRQGKVYGCNTYGELCDDDPIYRSVPGPGYDNTKLAKIATVANGTVLTARCWTEGGITYNYAASKNPPVPGPNPYQSDVCFYVQAPGTDQWGYIPDTYFVHDKFGKLGLPSC